MRQSASDQVATAIHPARGWRTYSRAGSRPSPTCPHDYPATLDLVRYLSESPPASYDRRRPNLRYFIAVAEEGSFSNAAGRRLHTAQPSLSRQIRDLEMEVGAKLLERRARGVGLTAAGQVFLDHARMVLMQLEAAGEAARRAERPDRPGFVIGFIAQNLRLAGETLGRRVHPALSNGDLVIATLHDDGVWALEQRLHGIQSSLSDLNLHWQVVATGQDPDQGARVLADMLSRFPARALLGTGQGDTEACGLAAKALGAAAPYVAGFDLSPGIVDLIAEGFVDFSIDQQPYLQG